MRFTRFDRAVGFITISLLLLVGTVSWLGTRPAAATRGDVRGDGPLRIVYTAIDASGLEQLYSLPTTTGDDPLQPLTRAPNGIWDFTVAPDGSSIIYTVPDDDSTSDFWQLWRDRSTPDYLLDCPDAACSSPVVSPDGRFLAFTRRGIAAIQTTGGLSPPRIWLLNLESGESAQVINDSQTLGFDPHWSADSAWISYLSPDPAAVGVYNLNDGRHLTYETQTGESGIWHPAENVFLTSQLAQVRDQFVVHMLLIDPVAGMQTNLSGAEALVEDNSPAWSPDGSWIAFRRKELEGPRASNGKQLWLMRADGSDARPLTQDADFDHGPPNWSPDGAQLIYHRFPLKGPNIVLSVWVLDVDTEETREVVSPGQRPQWWP